jgi:peptidoglycan hydrolase CwlO-like protein
VTATRFKLAVLLSAAMFASGCGENTAADSATIDDLAEMQSQIDDLSLRLTELEDSLEETETRLQDDFYSYLDDLQAEVDDVASRVDEACFDLGC